MSAPAWGAGADRWDQKLDRPDPIPPARPVQVRRSPLPSAGELDAEIERKLQEWDARQKRQDKPASSNGASK
jgi:hypothetical protein